METLKLVQWIGMNCFSKFKSKGGVWDCYWTFITDANNQYNSEFDDKLRWYSNEEIIQEYKKSNEE